MMLAMIEAAGRALLFALVVGAVLRLFRVSNVPVRKAAWTLVLIASLAMPFLMRSPAVASWNAQWSWAVPVPARWLAPDTALEPVQPAPVHAAPVALGARARDPQAMPASATQIKAAPVAVAVSLDVTPVPAAAPIA
ncbi:MAG TPA: hypothetical protein VHE33_04505, partial [Acidobacteriaceae bacterium]|nr:hypothetical protein [Acidobacteriaceae bacterium]